MTNPQHIFMAGVERWTVIFGPESLYAGYHLYTYQWIDDLSHFEDAEVVLQDWSLKNVFLNHFRHRFADNGWDGRGKLQLLWMPPFAAADAKTGFHILHTKRKHDGLSWIASRYRIGSLEADRG